MSTSGSAASTNSSSAAHTAAATPSQATLDARRSAAEARKAMSAARVSNKTAAQINLQRYFAESGNIEARGRHSHCWPCESCAHKCLSFQRDLAAHHTALLIVLGVLTVGLLALFGSSFAYFTPEPASEQCSLDCSKEGTFSCSSLPAGCLVLVQDMGGGQCSCHDVCSSTNFAQYRPVSFSAKLGGAEPSVFCPPPTAVNTWRIVVSVAGAAWLGLVCVAVYRAWPKVVLFALGTSVLAVAFVYTTVLEWVALGKAEEECKDKFANSAPGGGYNFEIGCNYRWAAALVAGDLAGALLLTWAATLVYARSGPMNEERARDLAQHRKAFTVQL